MEVREWIDGDESGRDMVCRLLTERPYMHLPPPFHKLPVRVGNVVELVGPSPCAKTNILMHSAIDCILPQFWNGVNYAGFGLLVFFIDLDCRFDVLRLSQMLKNRILLANNNKLNAHYDEDLFLACLRRFFYVRCYDSLEFLAILKTLPRQLQKEKEAQGISVSFMMIDSIGAFHWTDRSSMSLNCQDNNRKSISLQNVTVTVVEEIKKLLLVHPMIVIATKATILGNKYATNEIKWNLKRPHSMDSAAPSVSNSMQQLLHREYMPLVWQSFVTLRVLVKTADDHIVTDKSCNKSVYLSEWLLPSLGFVEKFVVEDAGIFCAS
ncbi:hypothetical protein M5689_010217 [Euphorbia peplus]|nr:hypothetical protein M5689_010217 [Euphorbia peplus]